MLDQYGNWYQDYPGQQPFQDPAYVRAYGTRQPVQQTAQQQPQSSAQTVEVLPADNERFVLDFPVGNGQTKLFISKSDTFVGIKSVSMAGEVSVDFFDKRPPAPPAPTMNPADYVRKDELSALIAEAIKAENPPRRAAKKEDE